MSVNYSIESFRQNVYELINQSQMPIGVAYFVFKDVFADISAAYQAAVQQEAQEAAAAAATEEDSSAM
jgi:TRAP-type C4-dicarboxylate transport system substrate-binding protein